MTATIEPIDELRERFEQYRLDPALHARQMMNATLWDKQKDICKAISKVSARVGVPSSHGAGKTFLMSCIVWWFIHAFPRSESVKVIITAPSRTSATAILAAAIKQRWLEMSRTFATPEQRLLIGLGEEPTQNGWTSPWSPETKIMWFATREDEGRDTGHASKAAGHHADHVLFIFEEASGILKVIWDSIKGSLMGADRRFIAIGNPVDPSSSFARFCRRTDVDVIHIDAYDFPNIKEGKRVLPYGPTIESIEEIKRDYGEDSGFFQWKVRGKFPAGGGENSLIPDTFVKTAREREPKPGCTHPVDAIGIGCDTSRFGSDRTCLMVICRNCGGIIDAAARTKDGLGDTPEMAIAGMIQSTARAWGLEPANARQIALDTTGGYGGGARDYLHEVEGWKVQGISFGETAEDEKKFANVRMELWWHLKVWIRDSACLEELDDSIADPLRDELTAVRIEKYNAKGQMILEAKEDIKDRLGFSPDLADALALAVHALPPAPRNVGTRAAPPTKDPYAERDDPKKAQDVNTGLTLSGNPGSRGRHLPDW